VKLFLMHIWEGIGIAFTALKANPGRSVLTTLGIVIGVLTVILMLTIVHGLNESFKGQLSFIGTGILYVNKQPWIQMENYDAYKNRPEISITEYKAAKRYSQLSSVVSVELNTSKSVQYKSNKIARADVQGVDHDYYHTLSVLPKYGRFLNELDIEHNRMVTVIGSEVAENLFKKENPIGRRIDVGGKKFRVIGVLEEQGKFLGFSMDNRVLIPYGAFTKNYGRRHWVSIIAKANNPERIEDLEYELEGIMRKTRGLHPKEENNFAINNQSMLMDLYRKVTGGVYAVGIGIGGISLLVGGIGIMNIMLVSVTERTREIGIRKAIGARRGNIIWQFLVESASICMLGGLLGTGFAFFIGMALNSVLPTSMSLWVAVFGICFSACVGIFFGLWPAVKAARLHPIEALRYE